MTHFGFLRHATVILVPFSKQFPIHNTKLHAEIQFLKVRSSFLDVEQLISLPSLIDMPITLCDTPIHVVMGWSPFCYDRSVCLGIANIGDETGVLTDALLRTGMLWIPNAQGIGPYSGKETFLLLGWFGSWVVLHLMLRKRDIKLAVPVVLFVIGLAFATLTIYTPISDALLHT